jgi:DNA-binding GntR family transcriptional regulator
MSETKKEKVGKGLKNVVYQDLLDKLIRCCYKPGTELNELKLTRIYGVSRTPVREAVTLLEMEGYLKVLPKKGIYVTDISLDNVLEIFQTRLEIEPLTLKMSIPYLDIRELIRLKNHLTEGPLQVDTAYEDDMAMHLYIIRQCRNHYIIHMMEKLFKDNTRCVIATGQNEVKVHEAAAEHEAILDSLIRGDDPDTCAALMKKHIETCRASALAYFSSPEYLENHRDLV